MIDVMDVATPDFNQLISYEFDVADLIGLYDNFVRVYAEFDYTNLSANGEWLFDKINKVGECIGYIRLYCYKFDKKIGLNPDQTYDLVKLFRNLELNHWCKVNGREFEKPYPVCREDFIDGEEL